MDSADRIAETARQLAKKRTQSLRNVVESRRTPTIEQSGWTHGVTDDGRAYLQDEDFTYDARLYVDGDWPSEQVRAHYVDRILTALTADKARDEALEEAAKMAEGVKYTKAYSDASYSAGDERPQIYNEACDDVAQAIRSLKGAAK